MFGVLEVNSVCDDVVVTSKIISDVFHFPLSTGVLYGLKMVT